MTKVESDNHLVGTVFVVYANGRANYWVTGRCIQMIVYQCLYLTAVKVDTGRLENLTVRI